MGICNTIKTRTNNISLSKIKMILKNKIDVWKYDNEFYECDLNENTIDKFLNVLVNCNQIQNLQFTIVNIPDNDADNKVL